MKTLLIIRNRIEYFYGRQSGIIDIAARFVVSLLVLLAVRANLGYNEILSQIWFVIAYSVVCAFVKGRLHPLIIGAYTAMQIASLSMGVAVTVFLIMLLMFFTCFRIDGRYGIVILLMMLTYIIKTPMMVPFIVAVIAPAGTIALVICGNIAYYMIHYININSAVIVGYADAGEISEASLFVNGMITYRDFLYSLFILIVVFLVISFLRRINAKSANDIAVCAGAGLYIILTLITSLIIGSLTFTRLRAVLIGTIAALIVAIIAEKIAAPFDFGKAEFLEFDDGEYHYYVRAVPRMTLDRENVHITRISGRKEKASPKAAPETGSGAAKEEAGERASR